MVDKLQASQLGGPRLRQKQEQSEKHTNSRRSTGDLLYSLDTATRVISQ